MKKNNILLLSFLLLSCVAQPTAAPTALRTETAVPVTSTATITSTEAPGQSPTPTRVQCAPPDVKAYSSQILEVIGVDEESCLPDKSKSDIGIYLYDLANDHELVSINADTPFQFASAFKGPVLVYFLTACRQYWDVGSPEWDAYFHDPEIARDPRYATDEYQTLLGEYISDVNNWPYIDSFAMANRVQDNGDGGVVDKRYFVLSTVYGVIARSNNAATGDLLQFVFNNCAKQDQAAIEKQKECDGPNALTAFNAWFDEFAGLERSDGGPRSGLYEWDVIRERGEDGRMMEVVMPTSGLKDLCVTQGATLSCTEGRIASNALTPRELFAFYNALYNLDDEKVRETAFDMLKVDVPGPARGYLKNFARNTGAQAMSKNGNAYFIYGSIIADAGLLRYRGGDYIVVTLSFNTREAVDSLYGAYDPNGVLVGNPGLIQILLDREQGRCPVLDPIQ